MSTVNNNNNALRIMASNVLGSTSADFQEINPPKISIQDLRTSLSATHAKTIFESGISTTDLAKMAMKILNKRSTIASSSGEFEVLKSALQNLQNLRDKEQFLAANPLTPLSVIPEDTEVVQGRKLAEGGLGIVHFGTVADSAGREQEVVVKTAKLGKGEKALKDEGDVGQAIADAYATGVKQGTLLSDVQGLTVAVVPVTRGDGSLIQEKITGMEAGKAIDRSSTTRFGNANTPQEAIQSMLTLAVGLNSLHQQGMIHHDINLRNIMFPEEGGVRIIDFGATAKEGTNVTTASPNMPPEHFSALEYLGEVRAMIKERVDGGNPMSPEEKALLQAEINKRFEATNAKSYDVYTIGTMLPSLFFGKIAKNFTNCEAPQNPHTGRCEMNSPFIAKYQREGFAAKIALMEEGENKSRLQGLNEQLQGLDAKCRKGINQLPGWRKQHQQISNEIEEIQAQLNKIPPEEAVKRRNLIQDIKKKQLGLEKLSSNIKGVENSMTQIRSIKKEMEGLLESFPADKVVKAEGNAREAIRQDVLKQFQEMNDAMQAATGKSYPEPVLERLAAMTVDCLSMDPTKRPSMEHIELALQNMGLSDWGSDQYNVQDVSLTPEQATFQGQFGWVRSEAPPPQIPPPAS
ncbi:MAG: protein kinase [Puniceicoccales bacterium]|nr:protein kinase [Puniceicoccales bacterium]